MPLASLRTFALALALAATASASYAVQAGTKMATLNSVVITP